MNKFAPLAMLVTLATSSLMPGSLHAANAVSNAIAEGSMVYGANGQTLAPVFRVIDDGSVQLIMDGRLITLPATGLSQIDGKLMSAQSKADLLR